MSVEQRKRIAMRAFCTPSVSGWLAKNPIKDKDGNVRMSGQPGMGRNWTGLLFAYVVAKCPPDVLESGAEEAEAMDSGEGVTRAAVGMAPAA